MARNPERRRDPRQWMLLKPLYALVDLADSVPRALDRSIRLPYIGRVGRTWSRILLWPLLAPFRAAGAGLRFLGWWFGAMFNSFSEAWQERRLIHLVQGLPAILAASAVAALAVAGVSQKTSLADQYRKDALLAFSREQYSEAKVFFERLITLEPNADESKYNLALSLEKLGDPDRAESIMTDLAPGDATGYTLAHMWQAKKILLQKETYQSQELLRLALNHLLRAEESQPKNADVQLALAQYYTMAKRPDLATTHLIRASAEQPELLYELSLLLASQNKRTEARAAAEQALTHYRRIVERKPSEIVARLRWAELAMHVGQFNEAGAILHAGLAMNPDGPFKRALAQLHVLRYDELRRQNASADRQMTQLQAALRYMQNFEPALMRLIELSQGSEAEAQDARDAIESLLAKGKLPAMAHFALGINAWKAKLSQKASLHFERAYALDASLAPIANNLAWVLAFGEDPDLERSLDVINSVLKHSPDDPNYRDTRGQILARMGRWSEALDDLEFAVPALGGNWRLHETLALVYEKLGDAGLSRRHATAAAEIQARRETRDKDVSQ